MLSTKLFFADFLYNRCWSLSRRPGGGTQATVPLLSSGAPFFTLPLLYLLLHPVLLGPVSCSAPLRSIRSATLLRSAPSGQPLHCSIRSAAPLRCLEIWLESNQRPLALCASALPLSHRSLPMHVLELIFHYSPVFFATKPVGLSRAQIKVENLEVSSSPAVV